MSLLMLMLAAVLALALSRPFHRETVDSLRASRHTHVQVAGVVTLVRHERDGDWHLVLRDVHGHFVVAEIVPYHPLPRPLVGQRIVVFGIRRIDNEAGHGWPEIHPVEKWEVSQ